MNNSRTADALSSSQLDIMPLISLFSKPLDFTCSENGSEHAFNQIDESRQSGDLIINTQTIMKTKSEVGASSSQYPGFGSPTMPIKPISNRCKKRRLGYADFDGMASAEGDFSIDWIGHGCRNDIIHNKPLGIQENLASRRSLICYEEDVPVLPKSRNQRRKEKKKLLKAIKENNKNMNEGTTNGKSKALKCFGQVRSASSHTNKHIKDSKRKAEDVEGGGSKIKMVCIRSDLIQDKELEIKRKMKKSKQPMSKSQLRKLEKSKIYKEKSEKRKAKEVEHQQGVQKRVVPCKFYINGCCSKGDECVFSHDVPQQRKDEPCKFYVMSQCTKGEACLYRHEWPCKFFHTQKGCKSSICKFSHEALTETTEAWLKKILEDDCAQSTEPTENEGISDELVNSKKHNSYEGSYIEGNYGEGDSKHVPLSMPLGEPKHECCGFLEFESNQGGGPSGSFYGNGMQEDVTIQADMDTYNSLENFYGNSSKLKHGHIVPMNRACRKFTLVEIDVIRSQVSLYKHFEDKIELLRMEKSKYGESNPLPDVGIAVQSNLVNSCLLISNEPESPSSIKLSPLDQDKIFPRPPAEEIKPKLFSTPLSFLHSETSEDIHTAPKSKLFSTPLSFSSSNLELIPDRVLDGSVRKDASSAVHKTISILAHDNTSLQRKATSLAKKYF